MPGLWMAPWTSLVAYFCNPITQKCGREDCNPKAVPLWECGGLWSPLAREGEHMLAPGPTSLLPGVFLRETKLQAIVFILKTNRNSSVVKRAKRLWDARILRKAEWELKIHDPWVQKHSNDDVVRTEQGSLLQWSAMVEGLVSVDEALSPHPSTEEKISTIWSHFYNIPQKAD